MIRMAAGSGNLRKKVQVKIPVYGTSVDEDESAALGLVPNYTVFPKIQREDIQFRTKVKDSKVWSGRRERVISQSSIVTGKLDWSEEERDMLVSQSDRPGWTGEEGERVISHW